VVRGCGVFLAMAELTRPFFILILPIVLLCAWLILRKIRPLSFCWLLIPLLLFSGSWHVHLKLKYGQFFWSNHGGFNLMRAWEPYYATDPEPVHLVDEVHAQPTAGRRWKNINTSEHTYNSQALQRGIIAWWVKHPRQFAAISWHKLRYFVSAPTQIYDSKPQGVCLPLYRKVVTLAFVFLFASGLVFCWRGIRNWRNPLAFLGHVNAILILVTIFSTVIMSLGEQGEEARMVVSLLPLLAVFPWIPGTPASRAPARAGTGTNR